MGVVSHHCNPQTLHWSASTVHFSLEKTLHEGPQDSSLGSAPHVSSYYMSHPCACEKISPGLPTPCLHAMSTQKLDCGESLGTRLKTAFVWLTFLLNALQITHQVIWKCPLPHQPIDHTLFSQISRVWFSDYLHEEYPIYPYCNI